MHKSKASCMSDILIKKYYLDCVDADGRAFIGYSAELEWRSINLHFQSYLLSNGASHIETRSSLKRDAFPAVKNDSIEWNSSPLMLQGTWLARTRGLRQELFSSPQCSIIWNGLQPLSDCFIQLKQNETITGKGYAECLELRLAEWRLPLSELKWGRFLSEDLALVWIDWEGEEERHLVFWNDTVLQRCTIADDHLLMPERNARLALTRHRVLKESSVVPPALANIPGLSCMLPRSLMQSHEAKWLSAGTLTQPDAPDRYGWAIHERVVFR